MGKDFSTVRGGGEGPELPLPRRRVGRFGWVPDALDPRDHLFAVPPAQVRALPARVDLRAQCPPVYDQGRIGSCTANAIAAAVQFDRLQNRQTPDFVPSRLFIYYNERDIEHDVALDGGAQLRDGIKSVAKVGVCPESEWPYDDTPAEYDGGPFPPGARAGQKPPEACYRAAAPHKVVSYQRLVQQLRQLQGCLAAGLPFVFGFTVFSSFFAPDGQQRTVIPLPAAGDDILGGHAVVAVGYDDGPQQFLCRNSWGPGQGEAGYFYLPYAYVTDAQWASDFWVVRTVAS